jgi:hypothetical protein
MFNRASLMSAINAATTCNKVRNKSGDEDNGGEEEEEEQEEDER